MGYCKWCDKLECTKRKAPCGNELCTEFLKRHAFCIHCEDYFLDGYRKWFEKEYPNGGRKGVCNCCLEEEMVE